MSRHRPRKTIGVIGGLGPEATVDFLQRVLHATPAAGDQDHVHLLVDCDPTLPNRNDAIAGRGPSPGPALARMAKGLEIAGADLIVMVCNTAHAFQPEIEAALASAPFLSLIDVTIGAVKRDHPRVRRVGILATDGCLRAGLYRHAARANGLGTVEPTGAESLAFMDLLYRIKSGQTGSRERDEMRELAKPLIERGAEVVIAACTEVPLVLSDADLDVPMVFSTHELVHRVVAIGSGTEA